MASVASTLRDVKDVPLRQTPDLSQSVVDMESVLEVAREGLFSIVDSCPGAKCLVFDPLVAGPLKLVLVEGSNTLKNHGVVNVQELNWADLEVECETIIYIIRPEAKTTLQVASQVRDSGRRYKYQVHYVPKRSYLCDQLLQNNGVLDLLKNDIYEYQLGFIPFDTDVLSLGLDSSFAQVHLKNDDSSLMYSARALIQLQETIGPIANIQVKGDQSKKVLDMILRMRLEAEEELASEALDKELDEADELDEDGSEDEDEDAAAGDGQTRKTNPFDVGAGDEENATPAANRARPSRDEMRTLKSDLNFAMKSSEKMGEAAGAGVFGQVDTLLLVDRGIDLVTPMCTALTYESLIDRVLGIRNGHAMVDSELVESGLMQSMGAAAAGGRKPKVSMSLNSSDHVYREIRDKNIDVVLAHLNAKARAMKEDWQEVKGKEVEHLHSYVQTSLRSHVQESQLLPRHINIVNRLRDTVYELPFRKMWTVEREMLEGENQLEYVEDCITRQEPWTKVLRLACLQSLVMNGIPSSALDALRRNIVHTYGFELIFTLDNLEKLGMLKRRGSASAWSSLVSNFRLIPPSTSLEPPDDIAYVTSGYAPLSVRVVQLAISPGWDKAKDALKRLPGRTIYKVKQPNMPLGAGARAAPLGEDGKPRRKVMLVFFTGGITFAEIAALRFISSQEDCPYHIVVASTAVMNGKRILQSLAHEMENRLRQL